MFLLACFSCHSTTDGPEMRGESAKDGLSDTLPYNNVVAKDSSLCNRGYKVALVRFDSISDDESITNTILIIGKFRGGEFRQIYTDSVYSSHQIIGLADYNEDGVSDLLVQNTSSSRSNQTFNLYIIDTAVDIVKKMAGFNQIANPKYLSEYKLIESYAVAGQDLLRFYRIDEDSIKSFKTIVYDDHGEDNNFETDRKKAIRKILNDEKMFPSTSAPQGGMVADSVKYSISVFDDHYIARFDNTKIRLESIGSVSQLLDDVGLKQGADSLYIFIHDQNSIRSAVVSKIAREHGINKIQLVMTFDYFLIRP